MRLIAAELLKIWTAPRTILGILLAEVGIVLIAVIATLHNGSLRTGLASDIVDIAQASLLFATLMGVLVATTEYRHGTITLAFLATPVREKVVAAKMVAAVVAACALVLAAVVLSVGIAQVWVGGQPNYHFGGHEWSLVGRLFLAAVIVAEIGLFIGLCLKRQLGAVILILGWLFFVEHALFTLFPGARDYLFLASLAGIHGGFSDAPSFGHSLAVLGGYALVTGTGAVVLTRRRDIT